MTTTTRSGPRLRSLLAVMMLLEHGSWGAWVPLLPRHLEVLEFSGLQIGVVFSTMALATLSSVWIGGHLPDRWIPAQRLLAGTHLLGAGLLLLAASATSFAGVFALLLTYNVICIPNLGVTNHIAFRHLADGNREFGGIRLWGTLGWILAGWTIGAWIAFGGPTWLPAPRLSDCLRLGALLSLAIALYALFLPHTPPLPRVTSGAKPAAALSLLRDRSIAVLLVVSFAVAMTMPFVYPIATRLLRSIDVPDGRLAPYLTMGQVTEILAFAVLGRLVLRWGHRTIFLLGLMCWTLRFVAWSIGTPRELVIAAIPLHGFAYALFFGLGQIYMNWRSPPELRASAQAVYLLVTSGFGALLGMLLGGIATDVFVTVAPPALPRINFHLVYAGPAIVCGLAWLGFSLGFGRATRPVAPPPTSTARQPSA